MRTARPASDLTRAPRALLVYRWLLRLLLPLVFTRLLVRGFRNRGYWRRWRERLGFVAPARGPTLWLHAVSVGEVRAAHALVAALRGRYRDTPLWITTTTPTGSAQVRQLFGDTVLHSYLPFDLPSAVERFLRRANPVAGIVMETEWWPTLFHACAGRGVPLVIANLRLSARSAARYQKFPTLTHATLACVRGFGVHAAADAERLKALGAAPTAITVTGSIKFDLEISATVVAAGAALRAAWGARPVWIAASTHADEEAMALRAHAQLRRTLPDALLVLVPRHPERFDAVARLARDEFVVARRSAGESVTATTAVYVGDTMGELMSLFAASDVAFVGGSLVPVGGHNILEPAALGVPVVVGPHMFNFAEIAATARAAGALVDVADASALAPAIERLLMQTHCREAASAAARAMMAANKGALARTLDLIAEVLPRTA